MQVRHIAIFGYMLEPNREIWKYIKIFVYKCCDTTKPKKTHILFSDFEFFF